MRKLLPFAVIFLTFTNQAPAADCPSSYGALPAASPSYRAHPPVLIHSENVPLEGKVRDLSRLRAAAKIILTREHPRWASLSPLHDLPDGIYIYAIDTQGHLGLLPRALDPGAAALGRADATYVGSHEGLAELLESASGLPVQLFAAGEVVVRGGRTLSVSNGSGSFRGGKANLDYALQIMKEEGLSFGRPPIVLDYSTKNFPSPHLGAARQILEEIRFLQDPAHRALLAEVRQVMRALDRKMPPEALVREAFKPGLSRQDQEALIKAAQFYSQWSSPQDGEAFLTWTYSNSLGETEFRAMLQVLRRITEHRK